jgi:exosortase B
MPQEARPTRIALPRFGAAEDGAWELVLVGLGLCILFVPTYCGLARGAWTDPYEAQGPFILAIAIGAAIARWPAFLAARGGAPIAGPIVLFFGLSLYALGRSQELLVLETASQVPVIAGTILMLKGWRGLRVYRFPVVFLMFTIIWPGWVIDGLTLPLKQAATDATVNLLSHFGYPIAATGVVIDIGRYQLLVADACSGLSTILSMMSIGVLYLHLMHRPGLWNAAILVAMPFIAFAANVLRVVALTLITYHLGDRAGQSFLHDFTGLFLFAAALGLVFLLDGAIETGTRMRSRSIAGAS